MNSLWLVLGSLAAFAVAYRFYATFLATKVAMLDDRRLTPAHRLNDGVDYHPTNRLVLFGVHFAAIAGPGPLVGPVLAAQWGYAPGFIWIVIGACLAFLRYNFNPASIFMGDSGALFLGFTLATISLMGVMKSTAAIALAVPLLIIGVPIFDTASAIIRRVLHKRPIQEADKGHIHHRLLGRGFDQRQTVLIIYVWSIALALGGYAVRYAPGLFKVLTFASLFVITGFMAYWLGLFEAASHAEDALGEGGAEQASRRSGGRN